MARNVSELRAKMDPTRRARVDARVKAAGTPGTSRAVRRFTLSEQNAEHVYDWLRMYWAGERERFGGCLECEEIGRRLERFIGATAVRRVGRGIKVHRASSAINPADLLRRRARSVVAITRKPRPPSPG